MRVLEGELERQKEGKLVMGTMQDNVNKICEGGREGGREPEFLAYRGH